MDLSFDGWRAKQQIERICLLGPRPSGSAALSCLRQQLSEELRRLGAALTEQRFEVSAPSQPGAVHEGINLIASWGPTEGPRILLGTHYDTRPCADEETSEDRRRQPILGANDGASGVAVLMEIARLLHAHRGVSGLGLGVDLVFFDAEEYVFDAELDPLILGSIHFASQLSQPECYDAAVVVDIVGRIGQSLSPDHDSWCWARTLVEELWSLAERMQAASFEREVRFEVLDDHIPLLGVGIPTCCLIDVDDPHWHTLEDVPEHCRPEALEEVGRVLWNWILLRMRTDRAPHRATF
jgi:hypothetical protein